MNNFHGISIVLWETERWNLNIGSVMVLFSGDKTVNC